MTAQSASRTAIRRFLVALWVLCLTSPLALFGAGPGPTNPAPATTTPTMTTPTKTTTTPPTTKPDNTQTPSAFTPANAADLISNAVMAQDIQGEYLDPVGITNTFPSNQAIFHAVVTIANAPENTAFKAVWMDAHNRYMGDYTLTSSGSRNLDFTFNPNTGSLAPGDYKVELYVNGTLVRTLAFTVSSAPQPNPQTTPQTTPQVQPKTTPQTGPEPQTSQAAAQHPCNCISEVILAEDVKGPNQQPVNPTVVFHDKSVFHALVRVHDAPASTNFKALWYVVDVGKAAPPNQLIDSAELTGSGTFSIDFTLTPVSTWPAGSYRVEISVNGAVDTVKTFSVK